MTWTSLYLVCFLLGFSLSAVSWLLGALHLHLPHEFHGGPHLHGHGGFAQHLSNGAIQPDRLGENKRAIPAYPPAVVESALLHRLIHS